MKASVNLFLHMIIHVYVSVWYKGESSGLRVLGCPQKRVGEGFVRGMEIPGSASSTT